MKVDDRVIPFVLVSTIVIIILLIAFTVNFLPFSIENDPDIVYKSDTPKITRNVNNIFYEDDNMNLVGLHDETKGMNIKSNTFVIIGACEIPQLENDTSIFLTTDDIFTITISQIFDKNISILFYNISNNVKNIKSSSLITTTNTEKSKILTLFPKHLYKLTNDNNVWKLESTMNIDKKQSM